MFAIDSALISGWISSVLWPFFRIGGFFLAAPIFGTQLVPARVRIVLAFLVTMILVPNLPAMPEMDALSIPSFIAVAQQLLIGIAMGFSMQLLLQLFVVAGQIIAMHMALGFASMVDPSNGVTVTVLSQFHLMLVTLLFVLMNGHLAMIEILVESFYALPVGGLFISDNMLLELAGRATWMFSSALLLALPAIASLMVINYSLGIVTRAAPQLNIFALGFPSMLIIGLIIIYIILQGYVPLFDRFTREALDLMAFLVTP
ncbi:MAG: flagellar biosynthetic protein FliR [Oceanicoccus sp.]|uniref:flagellar biosynthetic protein FliR n=1 Tax=Oceanicoccus sp. TaxID=2691044 RepID=UPI00261FB17F|nr:flagellar biosynthetic protein FliR [Oceanicoccus sp.]MCP3908125.1 flagellar biosynthetic protein FliR [Oceanicoccus sp.]MDG1771941.1 flagellar biosynthetic protein FliR [Oceanicoccus sp.]